VKAIQLSEFGGPEVLVLREVAEPEPSDGQVPIEVEAAGINWGDSHQAEDTYASPSPLPLTPGLEAVGRTPDGRRVVALLPDRGGYAEIALSVEPLVYEIPDELEAAAALSVVLQGATAWHLLRTATHLAEGEKVFIQAGASGVGSLAIQLAKRFGAKTVVASASSEAKRELCLELGADAVIDSRSDELTAAIREAAGGPVDVVLEMAGGEATERSLEAVAPLGRLAFYGFASRERPKPVDLFRLLQTGRAVIGFWLMLVFGRPGMNRGPMGELLSLVETGELRTIAGGTYPLAEARRAHEEMRAGKTTGKLVLDPRR
jgi:NADPH2:quinone reductase